MIYEVWRGTEKLAELPGHDAAQLFGDEWHAYKDDVEEDAPLAIVPDGYHLERNPV